MKNEQKMAKKLSKPRILRHFCTKRGEWVCVKCQFSQFSLKIPLKFSIKKHADFSQIPFNNFKNTITQTSTSIKNPYF